MLITAPSGLSSVKGLFKRTRKTVALDTLATSMGPLKGIERRGCTLKPSRVLIAANVVQSDGRSAQSGNGSWTRSPVICCGSDTVNRLLGKGPALGVSRLKRACTPAARAGADQQRSITRPV